MFNFILYLFLFSIKTKRKRNLPCVYSIKNKTCLLRQTYALMCPHAHFSTTEATRVNYKIVDRCRRYQQNMTGAEKSICRIFAAETVNFPKSVLTADNPPPPFVSLLSTVFPFFTKDRIINNNISISRL